ncbi:hypothetical protein PRN20_20165 [Devosia sp. ZB163]|uniref:hypothetical protein n=1 Tax=Devosia sp. ZB163 TaxID=3025938 RepID=UPI00235FDA5A|nr:hypothetical protein [Devosia sp. ZB163]MDC9826058.1 hypothetical protein [Devosia sp. ZB163]
MKTCWFVVIESLGSWWIDCEGKAYGPFENREEAQGEAKRIAVTYGDEARRSRIYAAEDGGGHKLIWSGPSLDRQRWSW